MLGTVWLYISTVAPVWWTTICALIFGGIVEALGWASPRAKQWLETRISGDRRRSVVLTIVAILYIWASFQAFSEEHKARLLAEHQRNALQAALARAKAAPAVPPASPAAHANTGQLSRSVSVLNVPPPMAPPAHLTRQIEIGEPSLDFAPHFRGNKTSGADDEIEGYGISQIMLPIDNKGNDTFSVSIRKFTVEQYGKILWKGGRMPSFFLPIGDRSTRGVKFTPPRGVDGSSGPLKLSYEIEYDTVPSTGKRITGKVWSMKIIWPNPWPNAPQMTANIETEIER